MEIFFGEPIILFCSYADTAAESGDSLLEITELEDEPLVSRLGGGNTVLHHHPATRILEMPSGLY